MTDFLLGNLESARKLLLEGLTASMEIGDEIDSRVHFEIAAALMLEDGNYEKAARLSGVAVARCEDMAYFHEPVEQQFREAYLRKLKIAMNEGAFEAAFNEGRTMGVTEAAELAFESTKKPVIKKRGLHLVRRNSRK